MIITKPNMEDVPVFYRSYVDSADETGMIDALNKSASDTVEVFRSVPAEKHNYSYEEGKWTVKEVLSHIIDGERVFAYRALRFSRKDPTPLPGFEENEYVPNSNAANRSMENLLTEYEQLRYSNIELFKGMDDNMLDFFGSANDQKMNARMTGWIIAGHNRHHNRVIREKYL
jgi:uncharacterized damage-inducible protein DinB